MPGFLAATIFLAGSVVGSAVSAGVMLSPSSASVTGQGELVLPPALPAPLHVTFETITPEQGTQTALVRLSWSLSTVLPADAEVRLRWVQLPEGFEDWGQDVPAAGPTGITVWVPPGGFDPCFVLVVISETSASTSTAVQCIPREQFR
jgi:hypothetical protein